MARACGRSHCALRACWPRALFAGVRVGQPDELHPNDVLLERTGKNSRAKKAIHITARTKAASNKTVAEAMELQIGSSGGKKRKYTLTEIKADIASKRLYVRRSLPPPMGGGTSTHPSLTGGNHPPHPNPKPNPKGKHNTTGKTKKTNQPPPTPSAQTQTTTTLLGMWLKTAEVREREMKPD
jgi:hypothetical protein